jgi:Ala-tRNA(Pro) deacylase
VREKILFIFFKKHGLEYLTYEHEPLFTVEDGKGVQGNIPGAHTKNLFLKDKKNTFFLVSVLEHKRVDLKVLSKSYGKGGLSFASSDDLKAMLNVVPGSVTPYGLIFDTQMQVKYLLDQDFMNAQIVNFHPLRNDMTVSVTLKSFVEFLGLIEHPPEIIEIPTESF